jgi:endonuclease/exonuclease/phosphatase family metal-dependent hydrolase
MTSPIIKVLSYNIHKGFSPSNRRFVLQGIREGIRSTGADVVFLQEVVGQNHNHSRTVEEWPDSSQFEFLADEVWPHYAYGKNAVYSTGHHGNAILSAFPIASWQNYDISTNLLESRGLLHASLALPGTGRSIDCFCVHMSLFHRGRTKQLEHIAQKIMHRVGPTAPFVLAGDFNDWRHAASNALADLLGASEAFQVTDGRPARTYPAEIPILRLDRIYSRGLLVHRAEKLRGEKWRRLSDHVALYAELEIKI